MARARRAQLVKERRRGTADRRVRKENRRSVVSTRSRADDRTRRDDDRPRRDKGRAENQEDEAEERFLQEAREKREKEKLAREQAIKKDAAAAQEAQRRKEPPTDPRVDGGEQCDLRDLETFLTTPTPRHVGTVHCYVVRKAKGAMKLYPEYRLYLKFGKKFLLAAKKKTMNRTSNYMITMSETVLVGNTAEKESVGKLRYVSLLDACATDVMCSVCDLRHSMSKI